MVKIIDQNSIIRLYELPGLDPASQMILCNDEIQIKNSISNKQIKMRKIKKQRMICFSQIQIEVCMNEFPVRTGAQLPELLQAYRKQSGMSQTEVASRLGVTQQTLSALERNAAKASAERLLQLLNILGVELVLRKTDSDLPGPESVAGEPQW